MTSSVGPAAATVTSPAGPTRLSWVDATRGYCVVAVALYHVVLWHYGVGGASVQPAADGFWYFINATLGSVRMPVLLGVSGLVLARQVKLGLHGATTGFRAATNYYLYAVWLGVYAVFYMVFRQAFLPHRLDGWEVVGELLVPGTTLWYLFALAAYIVVLALARRLPPWVVLTGLLLLSTVMHAQRVPGAMWIKIPELFIFFAIGVYGARHIRALAEGATLLRLGASFVAAAGVTALGRFADHPATDAALFVVRGVAFMVLCVLAVAIAVRWDPVRRLGVLLGRRTLAVYVMHPLWIALLTIVALGPGRGVIAEILASPAALLYPAVVTAGIVMASIAVQTLAQRAGANFLFEMPERWRAKLGRA